MPAVTEEQLYAAVHRGVTARAELGIVELKLAERRDGLITNAINAFNSLLPDKRMTERDALLFVAALSENQRLRDDLLATIREGDTAGKKLTK